MTPAECVTRIMLTCAKARSIAAENGNLEVAAMLTPAIYDEDAPLGLVAVAMRITAMGRVPSPHDAFNLLSLAHRADTFDTLFYMRWEEDLPDALTALAGWMSTDPAP